MIKLEAKGVQNDCYFALSFEKDKGELAIDLDEKTGLVFKKVVMKINTEGVVKEEAQFFMRDLTLTSSEIIEVLLPETKTISRHLWDLYASVILRTTTYSDEDFPVYEALCQRLLLKDQLRVTDLDEEDISDDQTYIQSALEGRGDVPISTFINSLWVEKHPFHEFMVDLYKQVINNKDPHVKPDQKYLAGQLREAVKKNEFYFSVVAEKILAEEEEEEWFV